VTKKRITLAGCDDATRIDLELSDDELTFIERLCALSEEASEYGCQPRMRVEEVPPPDEEDER
jgi:hypothetical protein